MASAIERDTSIVIADRFILGVPIADGAFGRVFQAWDQESQADVAVKLEPRDSRYPQLEIERKVYACLGRAPGIPRMVWFGKCGSYNVLAMERLGHSLDKLMVMCNYRFSLKTVLQVGLVVLKRLEYIHDRGVIHRDLKPENIAFGYDRPGRLYIIDFGLSKCYVHPSTKKHIPPSGGRSLTGTPRYASLNNHDGMVQSRRDDLESLAYIFVYLLKGFLPWQKIPQARESVPGNSKFQAIADMKRQPVSDTCSGLPGEFADLITYARALDFYERPDYESIRVLLRSVIARYGFAEDGVYDWSPGSHTDRGSPPGRSPETGRRVEHK